MHGKKIISLLVLMLMFSCSTKKNTWVSRNYNSLVAHYNTYYNGLESFKGGEKTLMKGQQNDYTKTLTVFPYSGKENEGRVKGDMDAAIGKAQKLIRKRSITVKPDRKPGRNNPSKEQFYNQREFNRWVDEAYMLIGKSHLYSHEFADAVVAFEYVLREYHNHPVRFEAVMWLARTRIEMEDFDNALIMLNQYDAMGVAPNKFYGEFMATYADYYIRRQQYESAIPYMSVAASTASGKWKKTRWNYILAQLYQQAGQYKNSANSYKKVINSNPDYEMNLNARLNLAVVNAIVDGDHTASRKALAKLARQTKNREFRDRIYYALAQSYWAENDTLSTITNLQLSAGYNVNNQPLKRETVLKLGEIYFDDEQYVSSFAYYDSTLTLLPELDLRSKQVKFRHEGLRDLSANYSVILREDSLQRLAQLDSLELDQFLDAMIARKRLEQMEAEKGQGGSLGSMADDPFFYNNYNQSNRSGDSQGQGQWYFYNITTVSLGKMEFERRWGRRTSEDNWRRSDKGVSEIADVVPSQQTEAVDSTGVQPLNRPTDSRTPAPSGRPSSPDGIPTKEELMADIPLTNEMMQQSNERLAVSYFNAGIVFLDHFKDPEKAIRDFRNMFEKFPEHELTDQALFWAYRAYVMIDDKEGMSEMSQTLKERFPNSRYTEFASDPLYAEKHLEKEKAENEAYEFAFSAYNGNRFTDAFDGAEKLIESSENESLKRKSHLLRAMSQGRMGNNTGFESELHILVDNYPKTQEGILANRWLTMLAEGRVPIPGPMILPDGTVSYEQVQASGATFATELYAFNPDAQQILVLIVNNDADYNRLYFNLAEYNFTKYILTDYDIERKSLADGQRFLTIGKFPNQREVMDYFYSVRDNSALFNVENAGEPVILAGSEANVQAFISSGDITGFKNFFTAKYLQTTGTDGVTIRVYDDASYYSSDDEQTFTIGEGKHWGLVVTQGRIDATRLINFLVIQASNKGKQIAVRTQSLITGENVLILDSFDSAEGVDEFFNSIANNYFWSTQMRARDWVKTAITPDNFAILEGGKSVDDYIQFQLKVEN